jgi:hypothetical protein
MKKLHYFLAVYFFSCLIACQQAPPVNADLSIEELTESIKINELISRGDANEVQDSERSTANNQLNQAPGVLTAGKWDDLANWSFWQQLTQNELIYTIQEYWSFFPNQRYAVELLDINQHVVNDCQVRLLDKDKSVLWQTRTNNYGKADLFAKPFDASIYLAHKIDIVYDNKSYAYDAQTYALGINRITLPVAAKPVAHQIDLMFIIDATGSMEDEINYLKNELKDVVEQVKTSLPAVSIQIGAVFYRDKGEAYLLKTADFTADTEQVFQFIQQQSAKDGGDYPEVLDLALEEALEKQQWSASAKTRLAFLVMDAPPHDDPSSKFRMHKMVRKAASTGVRIIPIASSGIDKETEFLMRFCALLTNGEYIFMTDHSGVGNGHIEPTVGAYKVQYLNDLLAELIINAAREQAVEVQ